MATLISVDRGAHGESGVLLGFVEAGTPAAGSGPALREPVGRIHWAGAEYTVEWSGGTEGAVRSGRVTDREVIATGRPGG